MSEFIIVIISGFGIYGAAVVLDSGVGNTWQRLTPALHEPPPNGPTPSRPHKVTSSPTHADYVLPGPPRPPAPGTPNRVMELMQEVAHCTCPYHLRRRVRRTAVISSTSSFYWSTAEEISSSSFAPQIHLIMARSFLRSRCRSEAFGAQVSLPWSIVDRTQAVNTLPRVLKEMCFKVRIGNSFLNLPQAAQQRAAIAWSQPPPAENVYAVVYVVTWIWLKFNVVQYGMWWVDCVLYSAVCWQCCYEYAVIS